jgi:hypothetical protein
MAARRRKGYSQSLWRGFPCLNCGYYSNAPAIVPANSSAPQRLLFLVDVNLFVVGCVVGECSTAGASR